MKSIVLTLSLTITISLSFAQDWASINQAELASFEEAVAVVEEDPNEGKIPLSLKEVPQEVVDAFQNSVFQHMEVVQIFRLQDRALDEIIIGDQNNAPFYLFEFRLNYEGKSFCQYFTPDGELYERNRPV